MEMKITGTQSVYKQIRNSTKSTGKSADSLKGSDTKVRCDEIVISGEGLKKQEAMQAAERVYQAMGQEAKTDRIAQIKTQIREGTYNISAEAVADRILSGK